ncbi:MAG: hypothetical protein PHG66_05165 [Candidatus Colwellbacteria bacterium]|nr:hypothetical protein [Candidatus Colwellbacteria bacterium]
MPKETCCPKFDPSLLDDKTSIWDNKLFIKDSVRQLFHIPLNMNAVITRMWNAIEKADVMVDDKDILMLAHDPSPWKSDIYMNVRDTVPGAEMVKISGTFISKVFDGPYSSVPKWITEMDSMLSSRGKKAKKYYFYYTTCPKCAKVYGHNYVVAFAEV